MMTRMTLAGALSLAVCSAAFAGAPAAPSTAPVNNSAAAIEVTISVDAANSTGPLNPIWRWCGYDEPNYTYAANGKKLISQFTGDAQKGGQFGPAYFRTHSLLCTGDGEARLKWGSTNAYTEDAQGKPVYDWKILDQIFDTYVNAGAKPYAQIGFMPKALSLKPEPYEHHWKPGDPYNNIYTGWTTPPNNYDKWRELNFQWAKHCLEKYGQKEVESWYWEVWNEYNGGYLVASGPGVDKKVDYQKIYDYAADGIKKAIPNAKIGGPETAGAPADYIRPFVEHCINGTNFATGKKGSPLDLFSFHAKGSPQNVMGHVRMGIQNQLSAIRTGFLLAKEHPETAKLPIVIGESDPDGCAACAAANGLYPNLAYRNGSLFASYTIEQLTRTMDLAEAEKVNLLGAVTWAFEFEDQPIFGGFRALATDGVELPVLNTFRMLNQMGTKRLAVKSTGDVGLDAIRARGVRTANPDVHALASRDERRVTVITWNYHDDDVTGPVANITLDLTGLPAEAKSGKLTEWRIDDTHSNAYDAWKELGSPASPTADQLQTMQKAAALAQLGAPRNTVIDGGKARVQLTIPRQGVGMVELSW